MKDITNHKFGKLTALTPSGRQKIYNQKSIRQGKEVIIQRTSSTGRYWNCRCDCGKTKEIDYYHLINGNSKSCGCNHEKSGKDSPFFRGYGEISLDFYNHIKAACQKPQKYRPQRKFEVSIEYLWDLFLKQTRKCALSGVTISFTEREGSRGRRCSASLDRIDSTKGYIEGNVQWVHKIVNIMKNDLATDEFQEWCRRVVKNT